VISFVYQINFRLAHGHTYLTTPRWFKTMVFCSKDLYIFHISGRKEKIMCLQVAFAMIRKYVKARTA